MDGRRGVGSICGVGDGAPPSTVYALGFLPDVLHARAPGRGSQALPPRGAMQEFFGFELDPFQRVFPSRAETFPANGLAPDRTESAIRAPATPLRNRAREKRSVTLAPLSMRGDVGTISCSPKTCMTRHVAAVPMRRARWAPILQPVRASTPAPLTSRRVGAQGTSSPAPAPANPAPGNH